MVETAAEAIGANSLLVKVSAYYHDIGKVKKPNYFIENQSNGENKHDKLSPRMSALVIISHIKDGCELAKEAKLGTEIVNIIREHHGNSLVRYFYDKAKKRRRCLHTGSAGKRFPLSWTKTANPRGRPCVTWRCHRGFIPNLVQPNTIKDQKSRQRKN